MCTDPAGIMLQGVTQASPGDTQVRTLRWVQRLTSQLGFSPSIQQIADARGLSVTAVVKHLGVLERLGHIAPRTPRSARSLRITDSGRRALKSRKAR